jgi:L-aspartate oxidase
MIVIGAGIAGLTASIWLKLKGYKVRIIYESLENSSRWAKGGIAAAKGNDDSVELHMQDTINVCEELCDIKVVNYVTRRIVEVLNELEKLGLNFDKDLRLEGGHSRRRIHHIEDYTGKALQDFLLKKSLELKIPMLNDRVSSLLVKDDKVRGVYLENNGEIYDDKVVLATGGMSYLFQYTTNPPTSIGDGIAIGFKAGTIVTDMEFIQFHPTSTIINGKVYLLTETLRGEGAFIINQNGERFLYNYHKLGELAPRDVIARAIYQELSKGNKVYMDLRHLNNLNKNFPEIYNIFVKNSINPYKELIPIIPAAHYTIGGIKVNIKGETNVENLYAIGETSNTGLHGANRLASNSLAECLVFGASLPLYVDKWEGFHLDDTEEIISIRLKEGVKLSIEEIKKINWKYLGIIRDEDTSREALKIYENADTISLERESNATLVSYISILGALMRKESRGVHYRRDFNRKRSDMRKHFFFKVKL